MLDVTKRIWALLIEGRSQKYIMDSTGCSISSVCKVRAEFNKQKRSGTLSSEPSRFPQKPRGKDKQEIEDTDHVTPYASKGDGYIVKQSVADRFKDVTPPSNYPSVGKPDVKLEENFEKGERTYAIKSYEINTLEDLIKWTKVDMTKFDCASFAANRWGNERWECTQCKAVFKPKVRKGITPEEAADVFKDMIKDYEAPVFFPILPGRSSNSGNIAESVAMDIHFGSLTRAQETGIEYNLDISEKDVLDSTRFHLDFMGNFDPEKIIMPVGSDFFNVDTTENTTTRGTPQSEDSTWKHTFERGCRLMVASIDLHKQIAPVEVMIIIGNHDTQRSFALGSFLQAWYRLDPLVEINNEPTQRKYFSWGTSLIGLSHGEERNGTNYLGLMNIEAREECGTAIYKEFHLGHKHHLNIKEDLGFRVRGLGGLTATDGWHSKMGYGALRESQAFIINDVSGIVAQSSFHPLAVL